MHLMKFIQEKGGPNKAADLIGCKRMAIHNWLSGKRHPQGLYLKRLNELGVYKFHMKQRPDLRFK